MQRPLGPLAIREASPQALHHFTQADQVNQLVGASEADPDLGFMARLLALCSLPRPQYCPRSEQSFLAFWPRSPQDKTNCLASPSPCISPSSSHPPLSLGSILYSHPAQGRRR